VKITYDAETDTLRVVLKEVPIRESEEERSGVILDYDAHGQLVAFEVLAASGRVDEVDGVRLRVRPAPAEHRAAE
jgi:uncharacterized protein YuzE